MIANAERNRSEPTGAGDAVRTIVVSGSASGIGAAVARYLQQGGHRVVGVDLQDADIIADLATIEGRNAMVRAVQGLSPAGIDGIVANAGIFSSDSLAIRVNYFGAIATLEGLRPLLRDIAPRAVVTSSRALFSTVDDVLVNACLAGNEELAAQLADSYAQSGSDIVYSSSKRAVARWVRRNAASAKWAGSGVTLNAVAPGSVITPMTAEYRTPEDMARVMRERPMPLGGRAVAEDMAAVFGFLVSADNTKVTGQVLVADGGGETLMCGDDVWAKDARA